MGIHQRQQFIYLYLNVSHCYFVFKVLSIWFPNLPFKVPVTECCLKLCSGLYLFFIFTLFYFTILYWFCHTLTWIRHGFTRVPHPEPPSHLPPCTIPLGHPSAPAPSILYPVLNIDWHFVSYMIVYMFQCHSPKSSHPLPLPQSPKVCSIHLCLFFCLAYRVIITIFLNSMYMCQYTVLVFFFLAYFTLYNQLQFHPSH